MEVLATEGWEVSQKKAAYHSRPSQIPSDLKASCESMTGLPCEIRSLNRSKDNEFRKVSPSSFRNSTSNRWGRDLDGD